MDEKLNISNILNPTVIKTECYLEKAVFNCN